jgi:hypothetical protein
MDKSYVDDRVVAYDRRKAVSIAGRIRAYWKQLGLDVRVEDGSIRSDMISGRPVRRIEHL